MTSNARQVFMPGMGGYAMGTVLLLLVVALAFRDQFLRSRVRISCRFVGGSSIMRAADTYGSQQASRRKNATFLQIKVVFCRVRVRSVGYESRTEVTELVGLGTVLYRTLPASPGFGIVLYRSLRPPPGTGMKGVPHTRVPVRSCYRNHRTVGKGMKVVQT